MENRQQRTLRAYERVLIFFEQHPISPQPPLLAGMLKSLQASVARISALAADQSPRMALYAGDVTHWRKKLRRDRMMPLARIAKPLLAFAPGVDAALQVPHARADALTVATSAIAMADALASHAKLLKSAGVPPDFLREMKREARQLALVTKRQSGAREHRSRATAAISAEFRKAKQTMVVLEGLVMLHLGTSKSIMQYWRGRSRASARIGRPRRRGRRP